MEPPAPLLRPKSPEMSLQLCAQAEELIFLAIGIK
jgi:hypothetical protein